MATAEVGGLIRHLVVRNNTDDKKLRDAHDGAQSRHIGSRIFKEQTFRMNSGGDVPAGLAE